MLKIDGRVPRALHDMGTTRQIEHLMQVALPPHVLMQRAGLAVARLALATSPHAKCIWIACGPGNNGGDGMEAAVHLQHWGKHPVVTWLGQRNTAPQDAAASYHRALDAGVHFSEAPPHAFDLCIDALLGIGAHPQLPQGRMAHWIKLMNEASTPVLAVDIPTGLNPDTGVLTQPGVNAQHTLSLLTLKPGLFTADGRDAAGTVWLDELGVMSHGDSKAIAPTAWLAGKPTSPAGRHASHKGSYGDVAVVGGAHGMTGAALLAASGALHAGAGRVFVGLLEPAALAVEVTQPELMFRSVDALDFSTMAVVFGCGGGEAVQSRMVQVLANATRLVMDADALNNLANDKQLHMLLKARAGRLASTVLTPHPLEAARLLGTSIALVQGNRLAAAQQLVQRFSCTVVLKGSGTVIASPGQTPVINPTGNARLATAGSGDVLAGMIGARLAGGLDAFQAACQAVYQHGLAADDWAPDSTLTAVRLARRAQARR